MRGFLAEGDAQVQRGVSGEREDPKRRAASEKLYGVCDENTTVSGEEIVSPSTQYVSLQQKGKMCKKVINLWVTAPKVLPVDVWGCWEFAHIPPAKTSQEAFLPHLLTTCHCRGSGRPSPQQVGGPSLAWSHKQLTALRGSLSSP